MDNELFFLWSRFKPRKLHIICIVYYQTHKDIIIMNIVICANLETIHRNSNNDFNIYKTNIWFDE